MRLFSTFILAVAFLAATISPTFAEKPLTLLNVSYDPTREFYSEYNALFAKWYKEKSGRAVEIKQSHGGSGKQARAVIDGLGADVVTLALAYDIDIIAEKSGAVPADWQKKLPQESSPYTSTVVFLVRKGNPKNIRDWGDLVREDVKIITPNPKTSGGARWNYLAAWAYAMKQNNGDEAKAKEYIRTLFSHVPVLDTGARAATMTFTKRGIGNVLIAWENETHLALKEEAGDKFEIVIPSLSIMAEPPVAVVEKNAAAHGTQEAAKAYLEHLYSPEAQSLMAKHFYRPRDAKILEQNRAAFPQLKLISIADLGGWKSVHEKHFADGAIFDQLYGK